MDNGPTNQLGAAVFWLYILAALSLSGTVIHTVATTPASPRKPTAARHDVHRDARRAQWLFAALAALSFAVLSANMLAVLARSFALWASRGGGARRLATPGWAGLPGTLYRWSVASTPFRDFAEAIVADAARVLWTYGALFRTLAVCVRMEVEGRAHGVPRLWAFFGLIQILPVAFTQNLFYLGLLRRTGGGRPRSAGVPPPAPAIVAVTSAYAACLLAAPSAAGTRWLMPVVVATRLLLLAPLALGRLGDGRDGNVDRKGRLAGDHDGVVRRHGGLADTAAAWLPGLLEGIATSLTICAVFATAEEDWSPAGILRALFAHPAVATLGCDSVLSFVSHWAWEWVNRGERWSL